MSCHRAAAGGPSALAAVPSAEHPAVEEVIMNDSTPGVDDEFDEALFDADEAVMIGILVGGAAGVAAAAGMRTSSRPSL